MNQKDAAKILGNDYREITRNKKQYAVGFDEQLAIYDWQKRIDVLHRYKKYIHDTRLDKAVYFLVSAALGSKYRVLIRPNNTITPSEAALLYRSVYNNENLASAMETLGNSNHKSSRLFTEMAKAIPNEDEKKLALEVANSYSIITKYDGIINDLFDRINIHNVIFNGNRAAVKLGDRFNEIVYNGNSILSVDPLEFEFVLPKFSNKGVILGWYYQRDEWTEAVVFYPYQILRFTFDPDNGMGSGLFFTTRQINFLSHRMERVMAIGRESRSVQIRYHYPNFDKLPEAYRKPLTQDKVEQERQNVMRVLKSGKTVDLFSDGMFDVKTIESDGGQFNEINDVEFIHKLFEIGLLVPPGIIDTGAQVNRSTMDLQIKFLKGILKMIETEASRGIKQLIKTELFLKDIDLDSLDIQIKFDNTSLLNTLEASQIVTRLKNRYNNFPEPLLAQYMGISWEEFVEAREKEQAMYGTNDKDDDKNNNT